MKNNKRLKLKEKWNYAREKIYAFLFPYHLNCMFCGKEIVNREKYPICEDCNKQLPLLKNLPTCSICGCEISGKIELCNVCMRQRPLYDKARAVYDYNENVAGLIHRFKYGKLQYLAKPMAEMMSEVYRDNEFNCDYIIFVPIAKAKMKARGYNQTELLANLIGKTVGVETRNDVVFKIRTTQSQSGLSSAERKINLKGVFAVGNKDIIKGKSFCIIDDVLTTGSTIKEIILILKKYKAREICVLSFARTNFYTQRKRLKLEKELAEKYTLQNFIANIKKKKLVRAVRKKLSQIQVYNSVKKVKKQYEQIDLSIERKAKEIEKIAEELHELTSITDDKGKQE